MYGTRQISDMTRSKEIQEVSLDELEKAIKSLNKGKAADIFGLTIEHIINAGNSALNLR